MDKWMKRVDSVYVDSNIGDEAYRFSYRNSSGEVLNYYLEFIEVVLEQFTTRVPLKRIVRVDMSYLYKLHSHGDTIIFDMGQNFLLFAVDTKTDGLMDFPTILNQTRRWVTSGKGESRGYGDTA
jgi:hypothetical protein